MKKFLIKLLIFVTPLVAGAFLLQKILDNGIRKTNYSLNFKEWDDIFGSKINADLLIQGTSRAWLHISPAMLDSTFDLYSYNLGIDGYNFHMEYYRYLIYLNFNKKPKFIIQTVDETTLCKNPDLYMSEQFIPFLKYALIREAVKEYNGMTWRDFYIPFYKYIGRKDLILTGLYAAFSDSVATNFKYKGFRELDMKWDTAFANFKKIHPDGYRFGVDTMTIRLFETFLSTCKRDNIKVIFVNTPEYFEAQKIILDRDSITEIFRRYAREYHIPYLDYTSDSICYDTLNFYNGLHLNSTGVDKFNLKLAEDLRPFIQ